jgi:hypothetical protein
MVMLWTLLALIWLGGVPLDALDLTTVVHNITLDTKYNNYSVSSSVEYIFIFSGTSQVSENPSLISLITDKLETIYFKVDTHPIRLTVQSDEVSKGSSILVVARHKDGHMTSKLPIIQGQDYF